MKKLLLFIFSGLIIFNCSSPLLKKFKAAQRLSKSEKIEDWEKAIQIYDEIVKMKIDAREYQGLLYRKLGKYHLLMGHYNDALENYKKAAEIIPTEGVVHYYIALCYSQLYRVETDPNKKIDLAKKAEQEYKIAYELDSQLTDALYGLGIINFYVWGNYKKGIEYMAEILKKDPKNIEAHFALARFYYEIDQPHKSLEFYKALLSLLNENDPRLNQVRENISRIYGEMSLE